MNLERSIWNKPMFATRMKRPCHPPVKYDNCAKLQKKSQNSFALKKILFILKFPNLIISTQYWIIHSKRENGFLSSISFLHANLWIDDRETVWRKLILSTLNFKSSNKNIKLTVESFQFNVCRWPVSFYKVKETDLKN